MKHSLETTIRLGLASSIIGGALVGCQPPPKTPEISAQKPNLSATLDQAVRSTFEALSSSTSTDLPPPPPSSTPTPENTPTPSPPSSFYEINGVRFDDPSLPASITLTLPGGKTLVMETRFNTDKSGSIANLCPPETHTTCTFSAENRLFIFPHSGYSGLTPEVAEDLRDYIEGNGALPNSPETILQKLDSLTGQTVTTIVDGQTVSGKIIKALRVPTQDLPEFTRNFVRGPEVLAKKYPELQAIINTPNLIYLETCGHQRQGDQAVDGYPYYAASRIVLIIAPDQSPVTSAISRLSQIDHTRHSTFYQKSLASRIPQARFPRS